MCTYTIYSWYTRQIQLMSFRFQLNTNIYFFGGKTDKITMNLKIILNCMPSYIIAALSLTLSKKSISASTHFFYWCSFYHRITFDYNQSLSFSFCIIFLIISHCSRLKSWSKNSVWVFNRMLTRAIHQSNI